MQDSVNEPHGHRHHRHHSDRSASTRQAVSSSGHRRRRHSRKHRHRNTFQKHPWVWSLSALAVVLLAAVSLAVLVGMQALQVGRTLADAKTQVQGLQSQIEAGNLDVNSAAVTDVQQQVHDAAQTTDSWTWKIVAGYPWLGRNVDAVARVSQSLDGALQQVPQFAQLAQTVQQQGLGAQGGLNIDLINQVVTQVGELQPAMHTAYERVKDVDANGLVPQIGDAVSQSQDLLGQASTALDGANSILPALPAALGANGAKQYVVLPMTPSEVRSLGGLPSTMFLMRVDQGKISTVRQPTADALPPRGHVFAEVNDGEREMFDPDLRVFYGDFPMAPQFTTTAKLTLGMWHEYQPADQVDGVLAMDPVMLGYLMDATGPITLRTGEQLDAGNVGTFLMSTVYADYEPLQQNAVFADASQRVLGALSSGNLDTKKLVEAVTRAGSEGRLLAWSGDSVVQQAFQDVGVSGEFATSNAGETQFSVLFNDFTWSKMSYYLRSSIDVAEVCQANQVQHDYTVTVTLQNTLDAATASKLTKYVTGYNPDVVAHGLGWMGDDVTIYAPLNATFTEVPAGDIPERDRTGTTADRAAQTVSVLLAPGESKTLTFKVSMNFENAGLVQARHTPTGSDVPLTIEPGECRG